MVKKKNGNTNENNKGKLSILYKIKAYCVLGAY